MALTRHDPNACPSTCTCRPGGEVTALYDNAFSYLQMGYASAIAWTLFLIIAALTALAFWASKGRVHYGGGS